jgi:broad specificity phosphatase PhoE
MAFLYDNPPWVHNGKVIKWPRSIGVVRHLKSAYNDMAARKRDDPDYKAFVELFNELGPRNSRVMNLGRLLAPKFKVPYSDCDTPLADGAYEEGVRMGRGLSRLSLYAEQPPDIIYCSPYLRAKLTLQAFTEGFPALRNVPVLYDENLREQEHGRYLVYNDKYFYAIEDPLWWDYFNQEGPYWSQFPSGENVPMVKVRNKNWVDTAIRNDAGKKVLAFGHHLTINSLWSLIFRDSPEKLHDKVPGNGSLSVLECNPDEGVNGRMKELCFDLKL